MSASGRGRNPNTTCRTTVPAAARRPLIRREPHGVRGEDSRGWNALADGEEVAPARGAQPEDGGSQDGQRDVERMGASTIRPQRPRQDDRADEDERETDRAGEDLGAPRRWRSRRPTPRPGDRRRARPAPRVLAGRQPTSGVSVAEPGGTCTARSSWMSVTPAVPFIRRRRALDPSGNMSIANWTSRGRGCRTRSRAAVARAISSAATGVGAKSPRTRTSGKTGSSSRRSSSAVYSRTWNGFHGAIPGSRRIDAFGVVKMTLPPGTVTRWIDNHRGTDRPRRRAR